MKEEPFNEIWYWKGRPINDMSLDELRKAFVTLGKMYQNANSKYLNELSKLDIGILRELSEHRDFR